MPNEARGIIQRQGSLLLVGVLKQPQRWRTLAAFADTSFVIFPQFNAKSQNVGLKCVGGRTDLQLCSTPRGVMENPWSKLRRAA
jgi:hypothetical protein